jgi:hypothetical protein
MEAGSLSWKVLELRMEMARKIRQGRGRILVWNGGKVFRRATGRAKRPAMVSPVQWV